jgi:hypothetical protein
LRRDGRGVGAREKEVEEAKDVEEVKENQMGAVLVAQPLLAVRALRSPLTYKFVDL